jgi:hypothetical protein
MGRKPAAAKLDSCGVQMRAEPPTPWRNTTAGAEGLADALFMPAPWERRTAADAVTGSNRMMLGSALRHNRAGG